MFVTILYTLYYLVGLFYLGSGLLLIFSPRTIEHLVPKFFPLLAYFNLQRISNAINLILMGIVLFFVAHKLVESSFIGLFLSMFFAAWEVYLAVRFYYFHRKDVLDAAGHLILNSALVIIIAMIISGNFSVKINDKKEHGTTLISIERLNTK